MGAGDTVEYELSENAFVLNGRELTDTGFLLTRYILLGSFEVSESRQLAGEILYVSQGEHLAGTSDEIIAVSRPVGSGRFTDRAGLGDVLADANGSNPRTKIFYYEANSSPDGLEARRAAGEVADETKARLGPLGFSTFWTDGWWNNLFDSNLA